MSTSAAVYLTFTTLILNIIGGTTSDPNGFEPRCKDGDIPVIKELLNHLRGRQEYTDEEIASKMRIAIAGQDYPTPVAAPTASNFCDKMDNAGYYADLESRCMLWHTCLPDGQKFVQSCPDQTIFNQITLDCDHWYNVLCPRNAEYYEWANTVRNKKQAFKKSV